MPNNLYVTGTEPKCGKSAIVLGMMQLLSRGVRKVGFFRPIITNAATGVRDHDSNLIMTHFGLNIEYEDTFAYTLADAQELINEGQQSLLLDNIFKKYKKLAEEYDFILCEGTDFLGKDAAFEFDLNADIAANLGCPVLVVTSGRDKTAHEIVASTQSTIDLLKEKALDVICTVVNRASVESDECKSVVDELQAKNDGLAVFALPDEKSLGAPTINDVRTWMDAQVLYGHGRLDTLVYDYVIAAMQVCNFLDYVKPGSLVITPGDRSDIILSTLASRLSSAYPDVSGILITGGIQPAKNIHRLIEGWTGVPIPILAVKDHTYKTISVLNELHGKIEPENSVKINTALALFERHVDGEALSSKLIQSVGRKSSRVTPKMFEFNLLEAAKRNRMRIVLPEGCEERILRAADMLIRREVADIILLGNADQVGNKISELGLELDGVKIVQPDRSPRFESYVEAYYEARKKKGISMEQAHDVMADPTYFGTMMVQQGDADGMVSGAVHTTAHTIRPAFEFVKTKPTVSIVSSVFLMCLKDRVHVFGDCAVNPKPTAEQLAEIAISAAQTASIFGIEPRVAMLSYSTGSSGKGADVEKVIEATRIAKERAPELLIEGPLQYDAAIDADVARTKLPGSEVAGKATVFIFPDLNTGNNTYKAVQRAADAVAIGPVLQGLNKPVNDLSRGCTVADIVNTVAITAIQAQAEKGVL